MCTVIYLPLKNGALFSSCRDESPLRLPASAPVIQEGPAGKAMYPMDGAAGGTWAGANANGYSIILLNGGFTAHQRQEQYRKSRGLIVKELLNSYDPLQEWEHIDLMGIEPFTLIVWHEGILHELVWDAAAKHHTLPSPLLPHIWSSATLYDAKAKEERNSWFQQWLQDRPVFDTASLLGLLQQQTESQQGFIMNRGAVRTISITFIKIDRRSITCHYHDLLNNTIHTEGIEVKSSKKELPIVV